MAAQSFAMGHAFGTSFQYGKRKISSMTNEEFNALSATDLHGELQADIRAMIPNMNVSFKTMERFQIDIINSMVNTLKLAAEQFFEWITTGKVTPQIETTTDISLMEYGEGGEVTYVQGGNRQAAAGSYLPNVGGYEQWLKDSGFVPETNVQRRVTQQKYAKEIRQAPAFQNLKPIAKVSRTVIAQSQQLYDQLILKRDTAKRMIVARRILYKKYLTLHRKVSSSQKARVKIQLRKALSLFRDAEKKHNDANRLLRNFKSGRPK